MSKYTLKELHHKLKKLDGKPYGQYRLIQGDWWGEKINYKILHTQGDPYANPSRLEVRAPLADLGIEPHHIQTDLQKVSLADFLHREAYQVLQEWPEEIRENFKLVKPCSAILARTSCFIDQDRLVLRLGLQLPGADRRIEAEKAQALLTMRLPEIFAALHLSFLDANKIKAHQEVYDNYFVIQDYLKANKAVAFIANKSILPRESGFSENPLQKSIPFKSPPSLEVTIPTKSGHVTGMLIPQGLTVITGGAFHGKSTLLQGIESAVYPRIPGDGRELVVCVQDAWKLRVEDGRPICGTDLSPLLGKLPGKIETNHFSTTNASGSTSQTANLIEAYETGTHTFLIDEDQSAVNFLFKDERMNRLIPDHMDPIRHLSDCIGELLNFGFSFILCQGASGDFLEEADLILRLNEYKLEDLSSQRDELLGPKSANKGYDGKGFVCQKMQLKNWPKHLAGKVLKTKVRSKILTLGEIEVHAQSLVQLACNEQLRAIGEILLPWIQSANIITPDNQDWSPKRLWDRLKVNTAADLALPRPQELWAVLRRVPGLEFEK